MVFAPSTQGRAPGDVLNSLDGKKAKHAFAPFARETQNSTAQHRTQCPVKNVK
jgi:hypothetical protein